MELVIFIGLQGSGKSTFYRERFAADHLYVSKDLLRNNRIPERRQQALVAAALSQGRSVVVDNTNPRLEDRAALVALARAHGARVVGYFFRPDVKASLARNARREGRAQVPAVAIFTTAKRLVRPTLAEGFDALYEVETLHGGGFDVHPLTEAPSPSRSGALPD